MNKQRFLVLLLLVLSLFLRLYKIEEKTEFLGDQGLTGIIIYQSLQNHTLPLAGPLASIGSHQGPIYYYLLAPIFLLAGFNPAIVAAMIALFGVITVFTILSLGKKLFGFKGRKN